MRKSRPRIYGLMAEFENPTDLVAASRRAYEEGYRRLDAYSPFPVHGLSEVIGFRNSHLPAVVLAGGLVGGVGGYLMQYYMAVIDYPLNVGGRPLHSWPAFIPVTFETTVLVAALSAVLGMLALNGLPMPYHPVFNVPGFDRATRDRFFLVIESTDKLFDADKTRVFLESLGAGIVVEVAH
ncbi:MAG: DUF3341 domain-containing protein [Acidobacteriota bacterium]